MAENTSVENFEESVQDDAVQAPEESNNQATGISEFLDETAEQEGQQPQDRPAQQERISGGIKGRLLDADRKGYDRGKSEAEAAWRQEKAQYEARLQKLTEYEIREEAAKLAESEHISVALAERLLRAERGIPGSAQPMESAPTQNEQPRDAQGRFVSRSQSESDAYAQKLLEQADTIKRLTGQDMMALYNSDQAVQNRILNREIDFYGLAEEMRGQRKMPPVVRSSNGQTVRHRGIADLSDEQFDELDRRLEQGAVFDMRR